MSGSSSRGARSRWLAMLLGAVVGLLCLEGGLRLLGVAQHLMSREPAAHASDRVVLCLGDSYTRCPGVDADATYPAQLQRLVDATMGRGVVRVVNRGQNAQNTTELLAELPENLERYQPSAVVLLTGGANTWDRAGLRVAQEGDDAPGAARRGLERLRVVRLLVLAGQALLPGGRSGAVVQPAPRPPPRQPRAVPPPPGLETACSKEARQLLGRLNDLRREQAYDDALELLEEAEASHGDCGALPGVAGLLLLEVGRLPEAQAALERAILLEPDLPAHYDHLGRALFQQDLREAAVLAMVRGLATSDSEYHRWEKSRLLSHLADYCDAPDGVLRAVAREAMLAATPDHPAMAEHLSRLEQAHSQDDAVSSWALGDIAEVADTLRARGVPLVLMNYPLDHPQDWWPEYARLAQERGLPFVDTYTAVSRRPDRDGLYLPDMHLNEQGNAIVAQAVHDELQRLGLLGTGASPGAERR
jgi:lysophospholipase L1-like esterase